MNATTRAYMAGIIDGEGCIFVNRRKGGRRVTIGYGVKVCVVTTDRCLVVWMQKHANLTSAYYDRTLRENRKQRWLCTWNSTNASVLLKSVRRFLVIKRRQADLAVELCYHLAGSIARAGGTGRAISTSEVRYRERIKKQISALNQRGRRHK